MANAAPSLPPRPGTLTRPPRRKIVSLETLLTHKDAFGLTTATPVQRAFCRAIDGIPLGELAEDKDVQWCFGGLDALKALEALALQGVRPREVDLVAAVRIGKTLLSSVIAFRAAVYADLTGIRSGEEPVYSIMAIKLSNAEVAINHLVGSVPNARLLRPYFLSSTKYSVTVRHAATGRPIKIRAVAGQRAGGQLASRWSCGLTLDEFGKMLGQEQGVVNYDDCVRVIRPRLRGDLAQIFAPGSPWAPSGPAFKAVTEHHGKPTAARLVMRCRGPMANPALYTPEFIEEIRRAVNGQLTVQTEVDAEFGDLPTQFFTGQDITAITRPEGQEIVPYDNRWIYCAFIDPATRGNAWTLVIVGCLMGVMDSESLFVVALAHEWVGSKEKPLNPRLVFKEMKPMMGAYGLDEVWSDQHNFDSNKVLAEDEGLTLRLDEATQPEKDDRYLALRALVVSDAPPNSGQPKLISIPKDTTLRSDLLAIIKKLTPTGLKFPLPVSSDQRHADYAPSTTGAVGKVIEGMGGWSAAMRRRIANQAAAARPPEKPPVVDDAAEPAQESADSLESNVGPVIAAGPIKLYGGVQSAGTRIRAARLQAGMTLMDLANRLGEEGWVLQRIEAGVHDVHESVVRRALLACGLPETWAPQRS